MVPWGARAAVSPYWGRTAARIAIGPYPRRVVSAIRAANLARQYGPGAARFATKIGRAFRSYKRSKIVNPYKKYPKGRPLMFKRTEKSAKNPSRKRATDPGEVSSAFAMGNLNYQVFPWPAYDNGTVVSDNLISRTRNTIKIKGIKICQRFQYNQTQGSEAYQGPIRVRWYLVQRKNGGAPANANTELGTGFFRTNHDGQNRNRNFNPNTGALSDSYDYAKICAPVNPDESIRIITKREFTLMGRSAETDQRSMPYAYNLQEWFPNGKRYTFDSVSSSAPNGEIFCLWWYYPLDALQYDPSTANNFYVTVHRHDQVYWSESP